jgi:hypothetical protein
VVIDNLLYAGVPSYKRGKPLREGDPLREVDPSIEKATLLKERFIVSFMHIDPQHTAGDLNEKQE